MLTGTRGRSRSASRARSHSSGSRSYDSRSYSDYSDEFYSEDEPVKGEKISTRKPVQSKPAASRVRPNMGKTSVVKGALRGKAVATTKDRDYVTNRVLSARRLKINELRNENEDLKTQLVEVARENKLLMRTATQQDKKLHLYENQESDMPRIIAKHNEEIRVAKDQLRRQKEKSTKHEQRLKETDEELSRTQRSLKKMKALVEDKQLDERDSLARKLSRAEADNEDKDKRVKDLEKHIDNLQKNHKHELGIERARFREMQKDAQIYKEQTSQLKVDLKDVRRDLEINNIYANRALKMGRASTRTSNISSPAPLHHLRKNSHDNSMPQREKAKVFEEQRREHEKQNKEKRQLRKTLNEERTTGLSEEPPAEPEWLSPSLKKNRGGQERHVQLAHEEELADQRAFQEERDRRKTEAEEHAHQEQNRERRVMEDRDREERKRWEKQDEVMRHEQVERSRREQQEKEDRQKQEQEDRQREEREGQELKDRERREQEELEEREQQERDDIERNAREERERMANDERFRAQERQKANLLAKMKALEKDKDAVNVILNDPFAVTTSPSKPPVRKQDEDLFDDPFSVPTGRKIESTGYTVDGSAKKRGQHDSPTRQRINGKNYTFGKPMENLHNGMPSHPVNSVPVLERHKRNSLFDEDSDGGHAYGAYQPTFTSNNTAGKQKAGNGASMKAKKDLMNDLFGGTPGSAVTRNTDDDDIFGEFKKPSPNANRRRPGGNIQDPFSNEEPPIGNSYLLPRRGRQPTTNFSSPAINVVDNFGDDIEEVTL